MGNVAGAGGGGMNLYASDGVPTITNCNITDNVGSSGGGVYISMNAFPDGSAGSNAQLATISNCLIAGNIATTDGGGGLFLSGSSLLTQITNCAFNNNTVLLGSGGGVNLYNTLPKLSNCNFTGNILTVYVFIFSFFERS